jgi:hypothetical protein
MADGATLDRSAIDLDGAEFVYDGATIARPAAKSAALEPAE